MASLKPKTKKKSKKSKSKKSLPTNASNKLEAVVDPSKFDGSTNWSKLQKELNMSEKIKTDKCTKELVNDISSNAKSSPCGAAIKKHNDDNHVMSSKNKAFSGKEKVNPEKENQSFQKVKKENTEDSSHPFSIGVKNSQGNKSTQESNTEANKIRITKVVAMDCEMVGTGPSGKDSVVARVSIVNSFGECIYDEYVKPKEKVTDYRTQVSGIRSSDLVKGKDLFEVQKSVVGIIEDKIVVGHALQHDFEVLFISHPRKKIRDTAYYKPFREISCGRTPSLKKLASKLLACEIQDGEHSSVEDAQAAMLLYLRHKKEWEKYLNSQKNRKRQCMKKT